MILFKQENRKVKLGYLISLHFQNSKRTQLGRWQRAVYFTRKKYPAKAHF